MPFEGRSTLGKDATDGLNLMYRASEALGGRGCEKGSTPVAVAAAAPGTGKSTLAEHLPALIVEYVESLPALDAPQPVKQLFRNHYALNLSLGGGTPMMDDEKALGARRALGLRALWAAFFSNTPAFKSYLMFFSAYSNCLVNFEHVCDLIVRQKGNMPLFLAVVLDDAHVLVDPTKSHEYVMPQPRPGVP